MFLPCQALIVSSDRLHCVKIKEIAARLGMQSVQCASLTDARTRIAEQSFQLVLCGHDLPDCNVRTALRVLTSLTGDLPVIVHSHLADWDACMRALGAGAFDYIACPPLTRLRRNASCDSLLRFSVSRRISQSAA